MADAPITNRTNEVPLPGIEWVLAQFFEQIVRELHGREERIVMAIRDVGSTISESYERSTKRADHCDRRLDRLEEHAGLPKMDGP